jgi:formylglycine-generating enzyme required for sulfatase activity
MGKYKVTFLEYDTYVWHEQHAGNLNVKYPADSGWGRYDRPVINVTRFDAQAYVDWLNKNPREGYRYGLPTEAEWEYAARAGADAKYPLRAPDAQDGRYGTDRIAGLGLANCGDCAKPGKPYLNKTTAVDTFKHNQWGLFDTTGNAWEWIRGPYGPYTEQGYTEDHPCSPPQLRESTDSPPDSMQPAAKAVLRGGAYDTDSSYLAPVVRYTDRRATDRYPFISFRLCSPGPP